MGRGSPLSTTGICPWITHRQCQEEQEELVCLPCVDRVSEAAVHRHTAVTATTDGTQTDRTEQVAVVDQDTISSLTHHANTTAEIAVATVVT